jgi:hypothetical protein
MKKYYVIFLLLTSFIWSCKKDKMALFTTTSTVDTLTLASVKIEAKNNVGKVSADVVCTVAGDSITAVVPNMLTTKKLALTFTPRYAGTTIKVGDTLQVSGTTINDFSKIVTYSLSSPRGATKTYRVIIRVFTGLPIIYLTTTAPVISKSDYVSGSAVIDANLDFQQDVTSIPLTIKGHGNSTWTNYPKKPYKMKFNSKTAMLGIPQAKDWILLANYDDKTLMRNQFALNLGTKIGADFTSPTRFVEVVMNGEYLGNYLLTCEVEVDPNRVNISELNKSSTPAGQISGGYLLELHEQVDDPVSFTTSKGLPFTIDDPDDFTTPQLTYIHNYIQTVEDAIFSTNATSSYDQYINSDSFINYYIVEEVMKNNDAIDWGSIYYYKDVNGKLGMGPIWDFDIGAGNVNYSDAANPTGWWVQNSVWFHQLFQDPAFRQKVKARWNAIKNKELVAAMNSIDTTAANLNLSQQQNFIKWPILNVNVGVNQFVLGTYPAEVAELKKWLNTRIAWMDGQISAY